MSAVFDASVVVKWFVDDPLTAEAREARRTFWPALAPSLILVEVANALRRYVVKGDLSADAAHEDLALVSLVVDLSDPADFIDEAFALACKMNHSMTDCLYVVMARRRNLPFVTADMKLFRKLHSLDGLDMRMLEAKAEPA